MSADDIHIDFLNGIMLASGIGVTCLSRVNVLICNESKLSYNKG